MGGKSMARKTDGSRRGGAETPPEALRARRPADARSLHSGDACRCQVVRGDGTRSNGKQVLQTIGSAAMLTIDKARAKARDTIAAIKAGTDRVGPQSFQAVSDQWLKRHVDAKRLRSAAAIRRTLDNQYPAGMGGREFASIRRGDVAKLLDKIEDKAGPVAADFALSGDPQHLQQVRG